MDKNKLKLIQSVIVITIIIMMSVANYLLLTTFLN